ncbi:DUF6884 domain-containing protein [Haloarchaeobius sp. DFWS5]|uniref:DUF6884 domain-containing protein n=1 Tax=Haloarchaeobius sp. DFWS5 TaxID=3446114 RepID=UPI003EB9EC09
MQTLLVQSCSKSKIEPSEPVPAFELYSGYFYKIIKKAKKEGEFNRSVDILILSAEHGILNPSTEIEHYDRKMDASRAEELRPEVVADLTREIESGDYDEVILNMGQQYHNALSGLEENVSVKVESFTGRLGERGSQLKQYIRTPLSAAGQTVKN